MNVFEGINEIVEFAENLEDDEYDKLRECFPKLRSYSDDQIKEFLYNGHMESTFLRKKNQDFKQ